jgi:hypothetical protein
VTRASGRVRLLFPLALLIASLVSLLLTFQPGSVEGTVRVIGTVLGWI